MRTRRPAATFSRRRTLTPFSAPAQAVERGKGVLFVYGNYAGDNLNFDMAAELLDTVGIESRTVRVMDDVASAPKERIADRRGIAGDFYVIKIAGAATAAGLGLEEAYRVAAKARDNVFSIGVALSGCTFRGRKSRFSPCRRMRSSSAWAFTGSPASSEKKFSAPTIW